MPTCQANPASSSSAISCHPSVKHSRSHAPERLAIALRQRVEFPLEASAHSLASPKPTIRGNPLTRQIAVFKTPSGLFNAQRLHKFCRCRSDLTQEDSLEISWTHVGLSGHCLHRQILGQVVGEPVQ